MVATSLMRPCFPVSGPGERRMDDNDGDDEGMNDYVLHISNFPNAPLLACVWSLQITNDWWLIQLMNVG